ncbi:MULTISPECIES: hypothetical protein [Streptomyces]|uniref:Uncharacterized protein n=1 Tax=Streptomyces ramulosus TaxID=47762 RepID=A0ABW1FKS7_9ACTN
MPQTAGTEQPTAVAAQAAAGAERTALPALAPSPYGLPTPLPAPSANGSTSLPLPPLAPVPADGGGAPLPAGDPSFGAPQATAAAPLPAPAGPAAPHPEAPTGPPQTTTAAPAAPRPEAPTGPPQAAEAPAGPQPPAGQPPVAPPATAQPPIGQPATVAERTMHAAGFLPLMPCPGAYEPWPCRCTQCGREVTPTYRQVRDEAFACACRGTRRRRPARKR